MSNIPSDDRREPIKVLADIIKHELELDDIVLNQKVYSRVMIYNEEYDIPPISGIYIVLGFVSENIISNSNDSGEKLNILETQQNLEESMDYKESQSLLKSEIIQIDIISKNSEARLRKEEIILAIKSNYAQRQQEIYDIQISMLPSSFLDLSEIEATARINRYAISVRVNSIYTKTKDTDYYEIFQDTEVKVNA